MADDFSPYSTGNDKDKDLDGIIRPHELTDFTGQDKIVTNLKIFIKAAKMRGEPLDHVLFHGPPGLGKTTLANIVANELGVNIIDEIHRLSPVVEEYLYSAMEQFVIDILIDKGPGARSVRLSLKPFTLVGATTRKGLLTSPLRARFGIDCPLEYYESSELVRIVKRNSALLNVPIDDDAALEIAMRSRGTPRIANALLRRVRDFAQVKGNGHIDLEIAKFSLNALNIDKRGLNQIDNKILYSIIAKFKGGPVGVSTIATSVGEDQGSVEEVYEPFLIKEGFIQRTPRGRIATDLAYKHLGIDRETGDEPEFIQNTLF